MSFISARGLDVLWLPPTAIQLNLTFVRRI